MPVSKDCIVYQAKEADVAILTISRMRLEKVMTARLKTILI